MLDLFVAQLFLIIITSGVGGAIVGYRTTP